MLAIAYKQCWHWNTVCFKKINHSFIQRIQFKGNVHRFIHSDFFEKIKLWKNILFYMDGVNIDFYILRFLFNYCIYNKDIPNSYWDSPRFTELTIFFLACRHKHVENIDSLLLDTKFTFMHLSTWKWKMRFRTIIT